MERNNRSLRIKIHQFYTKGKHNLIQLNEDVFFIVFYLKPLQALNFLYELKKKMEIDPLKK